MPQNPQNDIFSPVANPIADLIAQATHFYETDEARRGEHYLILMALHALDFKRRRFGPRAFDGLYQPMEARHER